MPLSAVATVDESIAVAVGARGTILRTTNRGRTWNVQPVGTAHWLSDVAFPARSLGCVVGWNGVILRSTDGGASWKRAESGTQSSLYAVSFCDTMTGVAVGFGGTVLRTENGGLTWRPIAVPFTHELRGVQCLDPATIVACGTEGVLLRTTDAGASWTRSTAGAAATLYRVRFASDSAGFAVGDEGMMLRTTNAGVDWRAAATGVSNDLWGLTIASRRIIAAAGTRGTLMITTDGGMSWRIHQSGTPHDLRGIAFADTAIGYAVGAAGTILTTTNAGGCLTFPFPQNRAYKYGTRSPLSNHRDAEKSYAIWKESYVTADSACGLRRVLSDDMRSTTSEGIGYGMLLAVNINDQTLFNDLWRYYKKFRNRNGLMAWSIGSDCTVKDSAAATDADEDAAFALLVADKQWCSSGEIDYRRDAHDLINRIWEHEIERRTFVLKPGDGHWGGSHMLNPSYFAPAYYRAFERATGNHGWRTVIATCYEILRNCAHPQTGLVPDWCRADGKPAKGREQSYYYFWDAARTPWRIALDYLWYGTEEAKQFCEKITRFASGVGAANIANGYYLDGKPVLPGETSVFVGPFGAAAMAAGREQQAFCDATYRLNVATVPAVDRNYYNWSVRTLTLFLQTGNFFGPVEE